MKILAGVFSVFLLGISVHAAVPYGQLEGLRRQSVVTRVALDNPEDAMIKSCGLKPDVTAMLGSKLESALDEAAEQWRKKSLTSEEIISLKAKISVCKNRGSCQVYEKFLSSVKVPESEKTQFTEIQKALSATLEKIDAGNYKKALTTVPEPCKVLKSLDDKN
ncbi:MAG: hypothetical protein JSU04_16420 [Bdellovibrionales bacterium]|nr:hypothetical protein [Bdellovibrionales bacterium]